jgi:Na+/H+-dicarboxylate symporter
MRWWSSQPLTVKIFIGMFLGIIAGLVIGPPIGQLKFIGDIFIRLIQVVVVPIVFAALAISMASLGDIRKFGRITIKVLAFYMLTTVIAAAVGLIAANLSQPGAGLDPSVAARLQAATPPQPAVPPSVGDVLVNLFPSNIFDAAVKAQMVQVVIFSIFFGIVMGMLGKAAEPMKQFVDSLYQVMIKMIFLIMELAPYAIFALMAWLTATTGFGALVPLAKYVLTTIVALLFQTFIVVSICVWLIARVNPLQFYKRSMDYMLVAFTTRSSAATLPIAIQTAEQKLGVSPRIAGFSLPLGSVMNQDGTVVWHGIAALFIAQFYGINVPLETQFTILIMTILVGLGTSGIPSGGLVLLAMILGGAGLPVEGIALIAGIDAIPDMFRTTLNVIDDLSGAVMVGATEPGGLDRSVFNGERDLTPEELAASATEVDYDAPVPAI